LASKIPPETLVQVQVIFIHSVISPSSLHPHRFPLLVVYQQAWYQQQENGGENTNVGEWKSPPPYFLEWQRRDTL
jgi:hypothetical protein